MKVVDRKQETTELTPEENRMYVFLNQKCIEGKTRTIRPYSWHRSHARKLYPNQTEKKARGLYRGYVLHLISLGLLVRLLKGLYYLAPITVAVKVVKGNQHRSVRHTKPFKVKQVGLPPARIRLGYVIGELEQCVQDAAQASERAREFLALAQKIKEEL